MVDQSDWLPIIIPTTAAFLPDCRSCGCFDFLIAVIEIPSECHPASPAEIAALYIIGGNSLFAIRGYPFVVLLAI